MGQINFEAWQTKQNAAKNNNNKSSNTNGGYTKSDKPYIGYFTLKNDKDYAIVRIMHDSPADFDMVTGHRVTVGDKLRMVNCLREDINDPVEKCPLCATGKKTEDKIYIHLIEYSMDPQSQVVATPKIWERSASYANTLIDLINEYGPLSDMICKITRNGAAGSKKTSYTTLPGNMRVYDPSIYVKDTSLFANYKAVGTAVLNYKAEKLTELANNISSYNNVEDKNTAVVTPRIPTYENPTPTATPIQAANPQQASYQPKTAYQAPAQPVANTPSAPTYPTNNSMGNDNNAGVVRPQRRYYN